MKGGAVSCLEALHRRSPKGTEHTSTAGISHSGVRYDSDCGSRKMVKEVVVADVKAFTCVE
jgi:hypothetical protein